MRKTKIFLTLIILIIVSISCFAGCSSCSPNDVSLSFNQNNVAQIGVEYDPMFVVKDGAQITKVKLQDNEGNGVELGDNYGFIPNAFGNYYYEVTVKASSLSKTYNFTVQVVDTEAPVVVEKPNTAKQIELGMYTDFETDLENIVVSDNHTQMNAYITKRAVGISFNGQYQENLDGYKQYFFDKPGEYTVNVEIKDLAGNVGNTEYLLKVIDSTAPVIKTFPLNYAWLKDGKVKLPSIEINDLSTVTETVVAKLNEQVLTIQDGMVSASVGDVIDVTYIVEDQSGNQAETTTKLKVLKYGQLIDNTDTELNHLFVADSGIIEYDNGILYVNNGNNDVFGWRENAFNFGGVREFSGISLSLVNYQYSEVAITVIAVSANQTKPVGLIKVAGRTTNVEEKTYTIDLTKTGLDKVDGWLFSVSSSDSISVSINQMEYTTFADPYAQVNVSDSYILGEKFVYTLIENGFEISDISISLKLDGTEIAVLGINDEYEFMQSGEYVAEFAIDVGYKQFIFTKSFVVGSSGSGITFDKAFDGGRVGEEYTLPSSNAGTVSVKDGQANLVNLTQNKFVPQTSGTYVATYVANGNEVVRTFYVANSNEISFETASERAVKDNFNGGLDFVNTQYVGSGKLAAKAVVPASSRVGYTLENGIDLLGSVNFVNATLYANVDGTIKLGFIANEKVLETSDIRVVKGLNKLGLVIGQSLSDNYENLTFDGIYIYNQSVYDNVLYIDSIRFEQKTAVLQEEIINFNTNVVYAEKDGHFIVPNVINCDVRLIDAITVEVIDGNDDLINTTNIGAKVSLLGLEVGNYTVKYCITVNEKNYVHRLQLKVQEKLLSGTINLENYYTSTQFVLPEPELLSGVLSDSELGDAAISKYYKLSSGLEWINGDGEIIFDNTGYVDLKYTVNYGDIKAVLYDSIYIHEKGVHLDFERWSDGENLGYKYGYGQDPNYNTTPTEMPSVISTDWAYDGTYSMKVVAHTGYTNVSGAICAIQAEQAIPIGFEADMVVFWAYSKGDRSSSLLCVDNYDWNWVRANLQIKKGVHKYVLPLDNTISSFKRFVFELGRNESFYIDNVSFVQSANISYPDLEGKQYDRTNKITVDKPVLLNASSIAFSNEDISNAKYGIEIFDGKDTVTYYFEDGENTLNLDLKKGKYEFTYKILIGEYTATSKTYRVSVRDFECVFVQPKTLYESGVEYKLDLPKTVDGVVIKAYSRAQGDKEWTELAIADGKALLKLNGAGDYELKVNATKGEYFEEETYQILVRAQNSVADFEINEDGSHVTDNGIISEKQGFISDKWSYDGNYSFRVSAEGHDYAFVYFMDHEHYKQTGAPIGEKKLSGQSNAFTMWINADAPIKDFQMDVYTTPIGESKPIRLKSQILDLQKGAHEYTFVFEKTFDKVYGFGFEVHHQKCNNFYVDSVHSQLIQTNITQVPTFVHCGEVVSLDKVSVSIDGKELNANVYYQFNDEDFTAVAIENGKYNICASKTGELHIKVVCVDDNGLELTYNYSVKVYEPIDDPYVDDIPWQTES